MKTSVPSSLSSPCRPSQRRLPGLVQRRGMALLFVVSLILFITLLGTSFVVVSQQFAKSAKNRARIDARGDSSRSLVQRAVLDLIRGPDVDSGSPLLSHSLLADMYGYGLAGEVTGAAAAVYTGGAGEYDLPGAIEFSLDSTTLENLQPGGAAITGLSDIPGFYNGLVLTFAEGPLAGTSVRVVGYSGIDNGVYSGIPNTLIAYPEQSRDVPQTVVDTNGNDVADLEGVRVVINGRAYQGWGAGGSNTGGSGLDNRALAPNRQRAASSELEEFTSSGVNESYDAPDYQNVFLSGLDTTSGFMPAFERQNLYRSQHTMVEGDFSTPQNFRAFGGPLFYNDGMAPHPLGNSTQGFTAMPLEVDNDGDGVADSVWIDIGLPVQTDLDGRRYKPLVSYLVLDMDSRLNVNMHGSLYNLDLDDTNSDGDADSSDGIVNRALVSSGTNLLGNVDPLNPGLANRVSLPYGNYYGPPEVSLWPLFADGGGGGPTATEFERNELYFNVVAARYGDDQLPGDEALRDRWNRYLQFGYPDLLNPDESYPNKYVGGRFGTMLDLNGRYSTGIPHAFLDNNTTPVATNLASGLPTFMEDTSLTPLNETGNSAYEFTLMPHSRYAAVAADYSDDRPYSAKELERFLRQYDRDSRMLPGRLWNQQTLASGEPLWQPGDRHHITTHSFETPAIPGFDADLSLLDPGTSDPLESVSGMPAVPRPDPVSVTERVYNLLYSRGYPVASINAMMGELLSWETRMGLPFDINRPFGDGRDNDSNGVYDEIDETSSGNEQLTLVDGTNASMDSIVNSGQARYEFAKQLFVLALLVTGDTADTGGGPVLAEPLADATTIRRVALAQWVVNVVDFRDSDTINTPFEFDFNPFDVNGWDADGDLTTTEAQRMVVWGCERPELLLSESLATHDRRTEDLSEGSTVAGGDNDFDSRLVPAPGVFFELYRPWTQNDSGQLQPRELGATTSENGIDLTQVTAVGDSPVWRLVVSNEVNLSTVWRDVDSHPGFEAIPEVEQIRRIYFVRPNSTVEPDALLRDKVYYPSDAVQGLLSGNSFIQPGGYAVIGSAGKINGSNYETWFGRRNTGMWDTELAMTRGVTLRPGSAEVEVRSGTAVATTTYDAVAIPIDASETTTGVEITRSLGVSDPRSGYYDYETLADVTPIADGFEFLSTADDPADTDVALHGNTVKTTFRSVFLQRLANPLQDYDPVTNPYLTMDRQGVDLTVFNGVTDDSNDPFATGTLEAFASNERGRHRNPEISTAGSSLTVGQRRRLWPGENIVESSEIVPRPALVGDTHYFAHDLYGSPGTINRAYTTADFDPEAPVGFAGLAWHNRPFANHFELMDVPFTKSVELLACRELGSTVGYTLEKSIASPFFPAEDSPYDQPVRGGWHGHLLNFFSIDPQADDPVGLFALMDFVSVPSRFAGTRIHVNDSATLAPPTNTISRYREPGKINVNNMFASEVYEGWLGPFASGIASIGGENTDGSATSFALTGVNKADFEATRRATLPADNVSPGTANRFDNPFRSAFEFDKLPAALLPAGEPVNSTLLRFEPDNPVPGPRNETAVFASGGTLPWANPDRSSFWRHETFRKIGGTTTTRSSVFAIWVTIGRFEVDDSDLLVRINAGTQEERGVEIGAASGQAIRSRGFYLIDRSIPVGFEPGANHNVDKMILVESLID